MRRGRLVVISLLGVAVAMGGGLWYAQTQAGYVETIPAIEMTRFDGEVEVLAVEDLAGIDAETSPLRYRACFATALSQATLTETFIPYPDPVPLTAPGWFDCFDAAALGPFSGARTRPMALMWAWPAMGRGRALPGVR